MSTQPKALRLADELVALHGYPLSIESAVEMRRLHEVNQIMLEALTEIERWSSRAIKMPVENRSNGMRDFYRAIAVSTIAFSAMDKATGEQK
jgi:hypothetical protein